VILFGPSSADALAIVRGLQGNQPLPWMQTEITPNLGSETSTADMRGGLELQGVLNLQRFVEQGGTLVTITNTSNLPIHFGMAGGIRTQTPPNLWAPGGVFRTSKTDATSPLAYGYGDDLGVYFNRGPIFTDGQRSPIVVAQQRTEPDGSTTERRSGRGGVGEPDIVQGRPRDMGQESVQALREAGGQQQQPGFGGGGGQFGGQQAMRARTVLRFAADPTKLLISGGLTHGAELAWAPALVDVPLGQGHIVMFSFNPFWRSGTLGSYSLVFNALLHHGNLDAGRARVPTTNQ
jgi:hypothetical protein